MCYLLPEGLLDFMQIHSWLREEIRKEKRIQRLMLSVKVMKTRETQVLKCGIERITTFSKKVVHDRRRIGKRGRWEGEKDDGMREDSE